MTIHYTTKLATEFSDILRSWLSAPEMEEVNRKNSTPDYSTCCASHEFCDPNVAMIEAFEKAIGRSMDFQSDDDMGLVNTAWALAKRNNFYTV